MSGCRVLARSFGLANYASQTLLKRHTSPNLKCVMSSTYGGRHTVTLIPADGIGPAMISGLRDVLVTTGVPLDFEEAGLVGNTPAEMLESYEEVRMAVQRNGVAIKGNWDTDMGVGDRSFNVALRQQLDFYANVVKCKSFPSVTTRHNNVDLVIVRENTQGEYSNLEHEIIPGVIEMQKIVTRESSTRIAKFAFEYARENGRKKVTSVHKANIMKLTDGLFLSCCKEVSKDYPEIQFSDMIVDNCAMQLVSHPEQFDVMVMPNLYGNVITAIAAGLIGGPGIASGGNHGDNFHVYESGTRNSGKGIAHLNIANPMSILAAGTSMLRHLGLHHHAETIDTSILNIVTLGKARTADIGGETATSDFFQILRKEIESLRKGRMTRLK